MAEQEEKKNPLLNGLVIDNISKYLSLKELKVCRGLNHLWKKTANKMFLKLCPTLFLMSYSYQDNEGNRSNEDYIPLSEFMEIYSDPQNPHPYAHLIRQYRNFVVTNLIEEDIPMFYNFITDVGPQMTSLKLENIQALRRSQDLVDIFSGKYTPELEELILDNLGQILNYQQCDPETVSIEGKENKNLRRLSFIYITDKIPWLDVLPRYPNLKALVFERSMAENILAITIKVNVLEDIVTALVSIRKANEAKLKLTELKITAVTDDNIDETEAERKARWQRIEDLLKTANLPLEKLALDGSTREISSALIQHYAENLKSLYLKGSISQPFPLMKALEEMVLEMCNNLTFLTQVPNLKSLRFHPSWLIRWPTRFPKGTPNPLLSLTNFSSSIWKDWNVTELEKLVSWMPNIQNLEMYLNNTTFTLICQHLPNLKELTVLGRNLNDCGVVGDVDGALVEGCRPNIANLKALETFKMAGEAFLNKGLTERSVFYGFSLMPNLSNLTINVKSELSAYAMLALNRRIKNVQVTVGYEEEDY